MAQDKNQNHDEGFEDLPDDVLDDLADDLDLESYEAGALDDERWDDDAAAAAPAKSAPKKKKGGLFNVLVIAGGVLVFLGFVYFKLASAPVPQPTATEAPASTAPVVDNTAQPPADMPDVTGGAGDVATVPSAPVNDPLTPMPDFASETGAPTSPAAAPVPSVAPSSDVATMEPQAEQPITPVSPMPAVPAPAETTAPQPVAAPAAPPAVAMEPTPDPVVLAPVAAPPLNNLPATMPAASDERLKSIEDQLANLAVMLKETQQQGADMGKVVTALDNLNTRLSALEKRAAARPVVATPAPEPVAAPIKKRTAPKAPVREETPDQETSYIVRNPVEDPAARPITPVAPRLTLRAVSNGVAYVARVGSNDLVPVSVGQSLPGVGQVVSIAQESGRWIVRGTAGRLVQ